MKKILIVLVLLLLSLAVFASPNKSVSMTGWLGDSACGAKKGPDHASCAKSCVKNGEKVTLIDDSEGKIYKIDNQDAVKSLAGEHVKLVGSMSAGKPTTLSKAWKTRTSIFPRLGRSWRRPNCPACSLNLRRTVCG